MSITSRGLGSVASAILLSMAVLCGLHANAAEKSSAPGEPTVAEVKLLSERGSTRSTRYAVTNKIVTLNGKTHFAWLDSISQTMTATCDHGAETWSAATKVGDGCDNHGGPALTCDSEGFLHIVFGPHHGPFQHCHSARPNDASEWVTLPEFGVNATYPSMVCDDQDTLHIIYRGGGDPRRLLYQRQPKGSVWSEPVALAHSGIEKGYTHFHSSLTIAPDQSLHISYDIYFRPAAKCAGHMMSKDRGATWTLADGAALELPVTPTADAFFKRSETGLGTMGVVCDSKSRPWISVLGSEIWHHDGTQWQCITIADALSGTFAGCKPGSPGPLTIDTRDRVYLPVLMDGDFVLLHSGDRGASFVGLPVFPRDAKLPHTGLQIERPTGHNTVEIPWLLFATGEKGPDCFGKGIYQQVRVVRLKR
jgi:putative BNR repeat neuraminidase